MKITIVSAYTWFNKGDAAILMGTLTELNEYYGENHNVEFNILTFTQDIDEVKYKNIFDNISLVESNMFNPYPFKKTKINKGIAIAKMGVQYIVLKGKAILFHKKLMENEAYRICSDSDLIIICGGGFLGGNKYNSLTHLAQIDILKYLKKPMILWGTSIEPPRKKILKRITEKILNNVNIILPREEITHEYLKTWYPQNQIIKTPDMAFKVEFRKSMAVEKLIADLRIQSDGKSLVGITMREWMFPKSENPKQQKRQYEQALIELINQTNDQYQFVFVPQVIMDGDDDRIFASSIKNSIDKPDSLIILENDYSPYELKYLISLFDQFLGTRMHSNIFCSTVGKAPVAIAYEKKTNGIMKNLDLSDYVIDIEEVNSQILIDMLRSNKEYQSELNDHTKKKVKQFKKEIREASINVDKKIKEGLK